jgi:hypothetical protein
MADTLTELEGPVASRLQHWAKRVLTASCTVLLCAGLAGLALVGDNGKPVAATRELARLQAFVDQARTAHFTTENHSVESTGADGVGTDYSSRSKAVGIIELPGRSQWTEEDGDTAYETVVTPTGAYYREADDRAALADELWTYSARETEAAMPAFSDPMLTSAGMVGQSFDAPEVADLLQAGRDPVRLDDHQIRIDVDVTKMPDYAPDLYKDPDTGKAIPLPKISVELTTGASGQLDRMLMRVREDDVSPAMLGVGDGGSAPSSMSFTSDIRFTRWGEPVSFAVPPASAVDPTPGVDEDDIAAFAAFPLYGLRRLPTGFELENAAVTTATEDASPADGDCAEVDLSYGSPAEERAAEAKARTSADMANVEFPPTIEVSLTPADCDYYDALDPADVTTITLGRNRGTIYRGKNTDEEYLTSLEVIVGPTRVRVDSDLPEAQTIAAASDLVLLDLGAQPVHHEPPPPTSSR